MLAELKMAFRFTGALGGFLHQPLSPEVARTQLSRQLADRDESFLRMLDRSVFGFPRSPYLALLKQATIQFDHIGEWVHQKGVEQAAN